MRLLDRLLAEIKQGLVVHAEGAVEAGCAFVAAIAAERDVALPERRRNIRRLQASDPQPGHESAIIAPAAELHCLAVPVRRQVDLEFHVWGFGRDRHDQPLNSAVLSIRVVGRIGGHEGRGLHHRA